MKFIPYYLGRETCGSINISQIARIWVSKEKNRCVVRCELLGEHSRDGDSYMLSLWSECLHETEIEYMRIMDILNGEAVVDTLRTVMEYIDGADVEECADIISEIRTCHDNICVWNSKTKSLDSVVSISINQGSVQLNVEE